MGYSIFYKIHDIQGMQDGWKEAADYINKSFQYTYPYAKSTDADMPLADSEKIDIAERKFYGQTLLLEKNNLIEEETWVKTSLYPYNIAVETTMLILTNILGEDIFTITRGDWESFDVWHSAAAICKRIGIDVTLNEVDVNSYMEGESIDNLELSVEHEQDYNFNPENVYAHCLFYNERDYGSAFMQDTIAGFIKIPAKSPKELEERLNNDIEDVNIDVVAKWNLVLNNEEMTQYFIETNASEKQWMQIAMYYMNLRED